MTSKRPPSVNSTRNVSVENFPCIVDDRYYLRRMKEILQDGLPKPSPPSQHNQVSGHVFIGNQRNADDTSVLRSDGIDHVLSCAASRRSSESPYDRDSGIVDYFLIPAEDREEFDITKYFDAAFLFLDRVKRRRGKALVHCNMGVNRSGAVVAAYLMVDERKNLLEVITYLKSKRRLILSNKGFRRQLVQFARSRGLLDPVIDTVTRISFMDSRRDTDDGEEKPETLRVTEVNADDKASLRQLVNELKQELRNGSDDEGRNRKVLGKWKTMENRKSPVTRESNDDLALNGNIDTSSNRSVESSKRISTTREARPPKSDSGESDPSPQKFSSSVQYWPVVDLPRDVAKCPGKDGVTDSPRPSATAKRRRYVRTRSDFRSDREKPSPENSEPVKMLSSVFCTLRARPQRENEAKRRSDIADDVYHLQIKDSNAAASYHSGNGSLRLHPQNGSEFTEQTSVSLRTRCLSSNDVDRPSSVLEGDSEFSGSLVLLGKKVVHTTKSSSQWNLATLHREPENFLSSESRHGRVLTRSRTNLSETSGPTHLWRSVEEFSESRNVFIARKTLF